MLVLQLLHLTLKTVIHAATFQPEVLIFLANAAASGVIVVSRPTMLVVHFSHTFLPRETICAHLGVGFFVNETSPSKDFAPSARWPN